MTASSDLQALASAFETTGEHDGVERARDRLRDLASPPLVFIMGEGKFGKSSLINALLGREVAPVSRIPKTWKVDVYAPTADGEDEHAVLYDDTGEASGPLALKDADARCEEAEQRMARKEPPGVSAARWVRDLPGARGCWFVDTPGFAQFRAEAVRSLFALPGTAAVEQEEAIVYDTFIHRSDFLLWCFKSSRLEDGDTLQAVSDIRKLGIPSLGLMTFADQVPPGDLPRVRERAEDLYGGAVSEILPVTTVGAGREKVVRELWDRLETGGVLDGRVKHERHRTFATSEARGWTERTRARVEALATSVKAVNRTLARVDAGVARSQGALATALQEAAMRTSASVDGALEGYWVQAQSDREAFFHRVREDPALGDFRRAVERQMPIATSGAMQEVRSAVAELAFTGIRVYRDGRVEQVSHEIDLGATPEARAGVGDLSLTAPPQRSLGKIYKDIKGNPSDDDILGNIVGSVAGGIAAGMTGLWRAATGKMTSFSTARKEIESWLDGARTRAVSGFISKTAGVKQRVKSAVGTIFQKEYGFSLARASDLPRAADKSLARLIGAGLAEVGKDASADDAIRYRTLYFRAAGDADGVEKASAAWDARHLQAWAESHGRKVLRGALTDSALDDVGEAVLKACHEEGRRLRLALGWFRRLTLKRDLVLNDPFVDLESFATNRVKTCVQVALRTSELRAPFEQAFNAARREVLPQLGRPERLIAAHDTWARLVDAAANRARDAVDGKDLYARAWCVPALSGRELPAAQRTQSLDVFRSEMRGAVGHVRAWADKEYASVLNTRESDMGSTKPARSHAHYSVPRATRTCRVCGKGRGKGTSHCIHCSDDTPYGMCPRA